MGGGSAGARRHLDAAGPGPAARAGAGPGRGAGPRVGLRGVPDRPAPGGGRPRAPAAGSRSGTRGRRSRRRPRYGRGPVRRRRPCRGRLAAPDVRAVPVLPVRAGEPVSGCAVHRVGRRRRICRGVRGAGGLRLPPAARAGRRVGSALAVRGDRGVSGAAAGGPACGGPARALRVRGVGARRRPGGSRAGCGRPRPDEVGAGPRARARAGGGVRGPCRRYATRAPGLGDPVRPGGRARAGGAACSRRRRHAGGGGHPPDRRPRSGLPAGSVPRTAGPQRHRQHAHRRRGVPATGRRPGCSSPDRSPPDGRCGRGAGRSRRRSRRRCRRPRGGPTWTPATSPMPAGAQAPGAGCRTAWPDPGCRSLHDGRSALPAPDRPIGDSSTCPYRR